MGHLMVLLSVIFLSIESGGLEPEIQKIEQDRRANYEAAKVRIANLRYLEKYIPLIQLGGERLDREGKLLDEKCDDSISGSAYGKCFRIYGEYLMNASYYLDWLEELTQSSEYKRIVGSAENRIMRIQVHAERQRTKSLKELSARQLIYETYGKYIAELELQNSTQCGDFYNLIEKRLIEGEAARQKADTQQDPLFGQIARMTAVDTMVSAKELSSKCPQVPFANLISKAKQLEQKAPNVRLIRSFAKVLCEKLNSLPSEIKRHCQEDYFNTINVAWLNDYRKRENK